MEQEQRKNKLSWLERVSVGGISFALSIASNTIRPYICENPLIPRDIYWTILNTDISADSALYLSFAGLATTAAVTLADFGIHKLKHNPDSEPLLSKRYLKTAAISAAGFSLALIPRAIVLSYLDFGDLNVPIAI
jgi:hypothetical protein